MGNKSSPRMEHVRPKDVRTYDKDGEIWVDSSCGGISTSAVPFRPADWWKALAESSYTDDLVVVNDIEDHYAWRPARDMPLKDYVELLKGVDPLFRFVGSV